MEKLYENFYSVDRLSVDLGGGGPFSYDIHHAIEIDQLITEYDCDVIVETGTCKGDTTEYLAKQYPNKIIVTSEINKELYEIARERLSKYPNVTVVYESSPEMISKVVANRPFYFLDAHGYYSWPVLDEIRNINRGIICIHDFDIGHKNYGFDGHGNMVFLDESYISQILPEYHNIYSNDPDSVYPYENKQKNPRGRAYLSLNMDESGLVKNKNIKFLYKVKREPYKKKQINISTPINREDFVLLKYGYPCFEFVYREGEPEHKRWWDRNTRSDWTVIDAGANVGLFSIICARKAKKVYAFEPCSETMNILKENIIANKITNIEPVHCALSNKCEIRKDKIYHIWGIEPLEKDFVFMTIDTFSKQRGVYIDAIKVDVDSFDYEVLEGAREVLLSNRPVVTVELSEHALSLRNKKPQDIIDLMESYRYMISAKIDIETVIFVPKEQYSSIVPLKNMYISHYTKLVERRKNLTKQIDSFELDKKFNIRWITEYDREDITQQQIEQNYRCNPHILNRKLSMAEISNEMAHFSVIEEMARMNVNGLIVEDDMVIKDGFIEALTKILSHAPVDWDIICIGGNFYDGKDSYPSDTTPLDENVHLERAKVAVVPTGSYIVSARAAKYIIQHPMFRPFSCPVDMNLNIICRNLNIYWTVPWLLYEGSKSGLYQTSVEDRW